MLTHVFYFIFLFISYVNYFIALSTWIKAHQKVYGTLNFILVVGTTSKRFNSHAKPS